MEESYSSLKEIMIIDVILKYRMDCFLFMQRHEKYVPQNNHGKLQHRLYIIILKMHGVSYLRTYC